MTKARLFVYFFILLVVDCGSRPAQTQITQWSPIENFQSREHRLGTSLENGGDSNTYYAIFHHLLLQKPKQAKDLLVCFLKTFTFSEKWVLDPPVSYLFDLLVNWGKQYYNAEEPGFTACQIDNEFRDRFEEKFEGIDIERVFAGEQMPKLLMIIFERSKSNLPATDSYHSLKVLLLFLNNMVQVPGLEASRIQPDKSNPLLADLMHKQSQSLHSLYQMTNWWNRCDADNNFVVRKLKDFKLLAEGGREYLDLYSLSHHLTFPDALQWKEVQLGQGLPQKNPSNGDADPRDLTLFEEKQAGAPSDSSIQPPPLQNHFSCRSSCTENLKSLAKVLIALGDGLEVSMINIDNHDYEVDKNTKVEPPKQRENPQTHKTNLQADAPEQQPATNSQVAGTAAAQGNQNPQRAQRQDRQPQEEDVIERPVDERVLLLQQRAGAGDANAQFQLGQHYYFGNDDLHIEPQRGEAMRYFQMAANNNHQQASIDLAIMLLNKNRRSREDEREAYEILRRSAERGDQMAINALAFMYENGIYVERNVDKAISLLLSAVNRKNYYSMAQYANMVFNHAVSSHLSNAFDILASCVKKSSHFCAYIAASYFVRTLDDSNSGLLGSPTKFVSLGLKMSCQELEKLWGIAAADFAGFATNKRAKAAYSRGEFEKAFLLYLYGYSLNNIMAARSLIFMLRTGKTGKLVLRGSSELHLTVLNAFLLTQRKSNRLTNIGDFVYNGLDILGKRAERFDNAYRLYRASNEVHSDLFTDSSLAHMLEYGLGVQEDLEAANEMYWKVLKGSLNDSQGGFFFPMLFKIGLLKLKRLFAHFSAIFAPSN